jgi:type I restriction enzyme S subunit
MENGKGAHVLGLTNGVGFGSTEFHVLRPKPEADARFIFHHTQHRALRSAAEAAMTGSAGQKRVPTEFFHKWKVYAPGKAEQSRIADILDTLDTQIQKTEALIAKLEKIKEGLLHDLLTRGIDQNGQLRPAPEKAPELYKESALGLVPKCWEVRSIAESGVKLIDGDRGANYPSDQDFTTGSGYCIFLSAKNVTRSGFRFDTRQFISKDKDRVLGTGKLVRNDVIVTTRGTVGNFAHYSHSIPYDNIRINSGMLILRGAESNLVPEFLYLSLKEHLFHRENGKKGSGSAQPQLPAKAALMDDLLTGCVRVTPLLANS